MPNALAGALALVALATMLTALHRYAGGNRWALDGRSVPRVRARIDAVRPVARGRSRLGVGIGVLALGIAGSFTGLQFARGDVSTIGLTSLALGGVLSGTLAVEQVSRRFRTVWPQCLVLPSIQLIATYSLFGVFLITVFSGFLSGAVVSGLLLACGFSAIIVTSSPTIDPPEGIIEGDVDRSAGTVTASCVRCDEPVDLARAIPDSRGQPCHADCCAEAEDAPAWYVERQ